MQRLLKTLILSSLLMISNAWAAKDVWSPIAAKACNALQTASSMYQKGKLEVAQLSAMNAYFKIYDVDLEPAIRTNIGPKRVFNTEQKFSHLIKLMQPNPNKGRLTQVRSAVNVLCRDIAKDAKVLRDARVSRQVFKAEA